MRSKIRALEEAFDGADTCTDHHALVLKMMLDNIDHLTRQVDQLTVHIEEGDQRGAVRRGGVRALADTEPGVHGHDAVRALVTERAASERGSTTARPRSRAD